MLPGKASFDSGYLSQIMDYFLRKLSDLRHVYGEREANHFRRYPFCQKCDERRLAALTVHHIHGRKISDEVETLCFNCHMIVHAPKRGHWTYQTHLDLIEAKAKRRKKQETLWRQLTAEVRSGKSLREVGRLYGVSHNTVRNALKNY